MIVKADHEQSAPPTVTLLLDARQSLTFDRGTEFASWRELERGLDAQAWFCDP